MKALPVVVVSGLRQAGKSTLLQSDRTLSHDRVYRTLDDFAVLAAARTAPDSLLDDRVTLDEVQRCPDLLLAIKRSVDARRTPGRFLLSGSANLALLGQVSESLAGRAAYFTLQPMTRREIRRATGTKPFLAAFLDKPHLPRGSAEPIRHAEILVGGLPPVCMGDRSAADEWFRGYVQTYLERDLRQLAQVADLVAFRTLAQLAALRSGQVMVTSSLARDAKLSASTAGRYLDLLEASFVTRRLPPFLKNRSTRLIKSPKFHFTDSGLAAHLAGVRDLDSDRDEPMRGPLLETYVAQNLAALLEAHVPDAELAYWHEQGRHEVDFVIDMGRRVCALEVKAAAQWNDRDLAGLRVFLERTPDCESAVLAHNGTEAARLGDRLWALPLGHLLA
jgi:predicted AAA+ superfamily ATPase